MIPNNLLQLHETLLKDLETWFQTLQSRYGNRMQCAKGCALCCQGLFDISLPESFIILQGFSRLPKSRQDSIFDIASEIHRQIMDSCPELEAPYFLCGIPDDQIDCIVEQLGEIPCPLLDEEDGCLLYDYRPLACRLEGIPMVDSKDGVFGDWCEFNFRKGLDQELIRSLQLDYYDIRDIELRATAYLSETLLGVRQEEITLFIPSAITASDVLRSLSLRLFKL